MPRPYSFDHFQAKKPQQSVAGTPSRLGSDGDKQKPLKGALPHTHPDELPGTEGGIHYGMEHSETVKRLQARRAKRVQQGGKAAAKRPTGRRATAETATAKTARKGAATRAAKTPRAEKPARAGTAKTAGKSTAARGVKTARTEPAVGARTGVAKAPEGGAKPGLLARVLSTVAQGSKQLVRQAALARQARAITKPPGEKAEKPSTRKGKKP